MSETCYRYSPVLSDENEEIADWLEWLMANKRSRGFGLCFVYLRNVQGYCWNHKRAGTRYPDVRLLSDNSLLALKSNYHEKTSRAARPRRKTQDRDMALSVDVIAERLGRNGSTIFRELRRSHFVDAEMPKVVGCFGVVASMKTLSRCQKDRK